MLPVASLTSLLFLHSCAEGSTARFGLSQFY